MERLKFKSFKIGASIAFGFLLLSFTADKKPVTIYLIGDSTMADYSNNYEPGKDYMKTRYPVTGWGQVFQEFFKKDSLGYFHDLFRTDSVIVDDRARGGRSTRTFFQEGRWRKVYESLRPGDIVMMQFGHNDAAENKPERYVDTTGYKEFLRLFVSQSREKGAFPIILTPVARNYPWKEGVLEDIHGMYDLAPREVALEMKVPLIDLNMRSRAFFTKKGKEYVSEHYFMNLPAGVYEAYPKGQNDNTHFQPDGARAVAQQVFEGLKVLALDSLKPSPYTIQTTSEKLKKYYPDVTPTGLPDKLKTDLKKDIIYRVGDGTDKKADIFLPNKGRKPHPAVLLVHGGGWISGSKDNMEILAYDLARAGYVAMNVSYTLSDEKPYPAALNDLHAALTYLRNHAEEFNVDPDRVAVLGASAGAQLASLSGVTGTGNSKVQAIINIDGIVSFVSPEAEEGRYAAKWLGGYKSENLEIWKAASPLEYVSENTPPILFVNSAQPRFHAGRDAMINELKNRGIYSEVHTIPDSPHSFWLVNPWYEPTITYITDFLKNVFDE
ncbi:alpha/beta hydrolase fold domain-containing protein [Robertkochia solimangrovi]|uniref:alpha/beta hydrolase fold domain-containing protein n=1 Tax=Robertkochia solimangrovi TaxID=2213046 RepID=UPI001F55A011|nr:alpha/beta hydrolase fold domain-containing protein [Robertkochia solimangrovi]